MCLATFLNKGTIKIEYIFNRSCLILLDLFLYSSRFLKISLFWYCHDLNISQTFFLFLAKCIINSLKYLCIFPFSNMIIPEFRLWKYLTHWKKKCSCFTWPFRWPLTSHNYNDVILNRYKNCFSCNFIC